MKKYLRKLPIIVLAVLMICGFAGCGSMGFHVETPKNVTAAYDGNGNVTVSWDQVENVAEYEIYFDGELVDTKQDSECVIADVEEGRSYDIEVVAIAFNKKERKFSSEAAESSLEIPIMVGSMNSIQAIPKGSYFHLKWEDIAGATSYEIKLAEDDTATSISAGQAWIHNVQDGEQFHLYIRPVRNVGKYTYYGEWGQYDITFPAYKYDQISFEDAIDLDLDRLKLWAETNGYQIKVTEKDGATIANVSCKDENNAGIINNAGRVLGSTLAGLLDGVTGSIGETYNEDFSDANNLVGALVAAGGVDEYVEEKKDDAAVAGLASGVVSGLKALNSDADIHYIYQYSNTADAAIFCESYMLNSGNESYLQDRYGSYETDANGFYHFVTAAGVPILVGTDIFTSNYSSYNYVAVCHQN